MIGSLISHYKILEKLGEGGMGVVYKAQDTKLDRFVALKFLPASLTSSDEISRFRQEAKAISALNHPNIATIYDFDESDDDRFLALEYLPGGTLKAAIQQRKAAGGELSKDEIVSYGIQIAEGLAHAHQNGIVHRDIKTENMLLTSDGRVKITDFGLAKLHGSAQLTRAGSTMGTAAYMSPEQIRGETVDHRSDIFSFGVVLFELATGQLPFRGDHIAALSYSTVHEEPAKLTMLRPSLPPPLEQIILRCLEKDVAKRYQQASEIVDDLRRLQSGSLTSQQDARPTIFRKYRNHQKLVLGAAALLLVAGSLLYFFRSTITSIIAPDQEKKSIAVLPFVNVGADPNMEYLSDGISEDLINSLSQLSNLTVMSRSSVFRYKGKNIDPQTAGKELGVQAVLTGSVSQRGDNLQISTEFIDVRKNTHIWGEHYNKKLADLVVLQEEISKEISEKLSLKLTSDDATKLTKRATENTEAYQLYLKGRYYWNKRSTDGLRTAISYFQQAVIADSNYALAYSGMADAYGVLGWFEYGVVSPRDVFPKAKIAAQKAIDLEPDRAEPYASLAFVNMVFEHDPISAEQNFKRSFERNPSYATAHHWHAELLASLGRSDESIEEIKYALSLDPLSLIITRDVGWMLYFARRYDEADDYCRKALDLDSNFWRGHFMLGQSYLQQGRFEQALSELETASRLSHEETLPVFLLGFCNARAGKIRVANGILRNLLTRSVTNYVSPGGIAIIYVGLGDRDKAFEWLNRALDDRSGVFEFIKVDPLFDALRADPRFAQLLKRMETSS
jgi:eukaryotic-like serine/threonine-protein kinase